jgi:hypothetical protein
MASGHTKRLLAQKNFLGSDREGFLRREQAFDTSPAAAQGYINQGLAIELPSRPSRAAAEAATADHHEQQAKKAAKASETKESTAKGANGLEPWDMTMTPSAYVEKYDGNADNSPAVVERLALAKAHVKAAAKG